MGAAQRTWFDLRGAGPRAVVDPPFPLQRCCRRRPRQRQAVQARCAPVPLHWQGERAVLLLGLQGCVGWLPAARMAACGGVVPFPASQEPPPPPAQQQLPCSWAVLHGSLCGPPSRDLPPAPARALPPLQISLMARTSKRQERHRQSWQQAKAKASWCCTSPAAAGSGPRRWRTHGRGCPAAASSSGTKQGRRTTTTWALLRLPTALSGSPRPGTRGPRPPLPSWA